MANDTSKNNKVFLKPSSYSFDDVQNKKVRDELKAFFMALDMMNALGLGMPDMKESARDSIKDLNENDAKEFINYLMKMGVLK